MPSTGNATVMPLREPVGRTAVVEGPTGPSIAPQHSTMTDDEPVCHRDALKLWRWQAIEPIRPERRLTLFQRLYAWLYDYNRY